MPGKDAMIRAVLVGAGSAIGKEIAKRIAVMDGIELAGAVERKGHPLAGRDIGEVIGLGPMNVFIEEKPGCIGDADVVLYFAPREALLDYVRLARENNVSIVIGTRGMSPGELERVRLHAARTRCVLVPHLGLDDLSIREAIRAAKWVVGRRNGLYDMQDIV